LSVWGVGKPVPQFPRLMPQRFAMLPIGLLFAVARRRRVSRSGVAGRRRISGARVGGGRALPRRRGRRGLGPTADQLAVVVADVADAMRDIEGRQLLAAPVGSAADRCQSAALHSEIPAALLVGARRQPLSVCREGEATERGRSEQGEYNSHFDL